MNELPGDMRLTVVGFILAALIFTIGILTFFGVRDLSCGPWPPERRSLRRIDNLTQGLPITETQKRSLVEIDRRRVLSTHLWFLLVFLPFTLVIVSTVAVFLTRQVEAPDSVPALMVVVAVFALMSSMVILGGNAEAIVNPYAIPLRVWISLENADYFNSKGIRFTSGSARHGVAFRNIDRWLERAARAVERSGSGTLFDDKATRTYRRHAAIGAANVIRSHKISFLREGVLDPGWRLVFARTCAALAERRLDGLIELKKAQIAPLNESPEINNSHIIVALALATVVAIAAAILTAIAGPVALSAGCATITTVPLAALVAEIRRRG